MTNQELDGYLKGVIKKASEQSTHTRSVEDIMFEIFQTIAAHYNNRVPQSVYDVFTSNLPSFNEYFKKKMEEAKNAEREATSKKDSCVQAKNAIVNQINAIDAEAIHVSDKLYDTPDEIRLKVKSVRSLLNLIVTDESMGDPESLNQALMYLYQLHTYVENGKKYVPESVHKEFIAKCPSFEKHLSAFNKEPERIALEEQQSKANEDVVESMLAIQKASSGIYTIYDDVTPKTYDDSYDRYYDPCRGSSYGSFTMKQGC